MRASALICRKAPTCDLVLGGPEGLGWRSHLLVCGVRTVAVDASVRVHILTCDSTKISVIIFGLCGGSTKTAFGLEAQVRELCQG